MYRLKKYRWLLQNNHDARIMEVLVTKESYSGTAVNDKTRVSYETGKSGAWKYFMADIVLALKEEEIKAEDIPVHMHQGNT